MHVLCIIVSIIFNYNELILRILSLTNVNNFVIYVQSVKSVYVPGGSFLRGVIATLTGLKDLLEQVSHPPAVLSTVKNTNYSTYCSSC